MFPLRLVACAVFALSLFAASLPRVSAQQPNSSQKASTSETGSIFVSNNFDGTVSVISAKSYHVTRTIRLLAQNVNAVSATIHLGQIRASTDNMSLSSDGSKLNVVVDGFEWDRNTPSIGGPAVIVVSTANDSITSTITDLSTIIKNFGINTVWPRLSPALGAVSSPSVNSDSNKLYITDVNSEYKNGGMNVVWVFPTALWLKTYPIGRPGEGGANAPLFISTALDTPRGRLKFPVGLKQVSVHGPGLSTTGMIIPQTVDFIPVGHGPDGVVVSPDNKTVYVSNGGDNTVSVISTASNTVTATIPVGVAPQGIAVSPDGTAVYVANHGNSADNFSGTVSVISTATNKVTHTIPVGRGPVGLVVSGKPPLSDPSFEITRVVLKDQTDPKATLDLTKMPYQLPFYFGPKAAAPNAMSDIVHWETSPAPDGKTGHWKVTLPLLSTLVGGKIEGIGPPPDFQVAVQPSTGYLHKRRGALNFTLEAWLTTGTSIMKIQDTILKITQDELGQLRQEYADHPLMPVKKDVYGKDTGLKRVPDVRDFVDTVNSNLYDARYNHGDHAGTWPTGTAGSQWAIVNSWTVHLDGELRMPKLNSAWRGPVYYYKYVSNKGGSQHLWGDAIDYNVGHTRSLSDYNTVAQQVCAASNPSGQVIWEDVTDHVHVQHFYNGKPKVKAVGLNTTLAKPANARKPAFEKNTIPVGNTLNCLVVLSQTGHDPTTVTLKSNDPEIVQFSNTNNPNPVSTLTISIPANALTSSFNIITNNITPPLNNSKNVLITATSGTSAVGTLIVIPAPPAH